MSEWIAHVQTRLELSRLIRHRAKVGNTAGISSGSIVQMFRGITPPLHLHPGSYMPSDPPEHDDRGIAAAHSPGPADHCTAASASPAEGAIQSPRLTPDESDTLEALTLLRNGTVAHEGHTPNQEDESETLETLTLLRHDTAAHEGHTPNQARSAGPLCPSLGEPHASLIQQGFTASQIKKLSGFQHSASSLEELLKQLPCLTGAGFSPEQITKIANRESARPVLRALVENLANLKAREFDATLLTELCSKTRHCSKKAVIAAATGRWHEFIQLKEFMSIAARRSGQHDLAWLEANYAFLSQKQVPHQEIVAAAVDLKKRKRLSRQHGVADTTDNSQALRDSGATHPEHPGDQPHYGHPLTWQQLSMLQKQPQQEARDRPDMQTPSPKRNRNA